MWKSHYRYHCSCYGKNIYQCRRLPRWYPEHCVPQNRWTFITKPNTIVTVPFTTQLQFAPNAIVVVEVFVPRSTGQLSLLPQKQCPGSVCSKLYLSSCLWRYHHTYRPDRYRLPGWSYHTWSEWWILYHRPHTGANSRFTKRRYFPGGCYY